jgi:hypothetical protein
MDNTPSHLNLPERIHGTWLLDNSVLFNIPMPKSIALEGKELTSKERVFNSLFGNIDPRNPITLIQPIQHYL